VFPSNNGCSVNLPCSVTVPSGLHVFATRILRIGSAGRLHNKPILRNANIAFALNFLLIVIALYFLYNSKKEPGIQALHTQNV
jgi:hypothetical protein